MSCLPWKILIFITKIYVYVWFQYNTESSKHASGDNLRDKHKLWSNTSCLTKTYMWINCTWMYTFMQHILISTTSELKIAIPYTCYMFACYLIWIFACTCKLIVLIKLFLMITCITNYNVVDVFKCQYIRAYYMCTTYRWNTNFSCIRRNVFFLNRNWPRWEILLKCWKIKAHLKTTFSL